MPKYIEKGSEGGIEINKTNGSNKCNDGDWPKWQTLNPKVEQFNISNLDIWAMLLSHLFSRMYRSSSFRVWNWLKFACKRNVVQTKSRTFFFNNILKIGFFFSFTCQTRIGTIIIYFWKLDLKVIHKSKKPTNIGFSTF